MTLDERIEAYKKRKAKEYAILEDSGIPFEYNDRKAYLAGFEAGRKVGELEIQILDHLDEDAEDELEALLRDGE